MAKFKVLRRHEGDRFYEVGEVREGKKTDLEHLVPAILEPVEDDAPEEKSEPAAPANKARRAAPANKAAKGAKA